MEDPAFYQQEGDVITNAVNRLQELHEELSVLVSPLGRIGIVIKTVSKWYVALMERSVVATPARLGGAGVSLYFNSQEILRYAQDDIFNITYSNLFSLGVLSTMGRESILQSERSSSSSSITGGACPRANAHTPLSFIIWATS